jgi:uncharacterized repeat protein (TIGR03803 family)
MNPKRPVNAVGLSLVVLVLLTMCAIAAWASTEKVLHNFGAAGDGANPQAGMVFDNQGNLYGTTVNGGLANCGACGIIFQLAPNQNGTWAENVLHNFNGQDGGFDPNPVVFDRRGNLYGASPCAGQDCFLFVGGTVFQLTPSAGGNWAFRVIWNLEDNYHDGAYPSGLGFDGSGHLYVSNLEGGTGGDGLVFLLGQVSVLNWYEIVAHYFVGGSGDGSGPTGALAFDNSGNVYGVTTDGGAHNDGTVYKLTPNHSSFGWSETILYQFTGGNDGKFPNGVVLDAAGNLYGTTEEGGAGGLGTVFELTPNQNGTWTENVLHSFAGGSDGATPLSWPTLDAAGNLDGTTNQGGPSNAGTVYKVTQSQGQWQESILYSFTGGADGGNPYSSVVLDSAGNIYGTAYHGGAYNNGGVAFEISR